LHHRQRSAASRSDEAGQQSSRPADLAECSHSCTPSPKCRRPLCMAASSHGSGPAAVAVAGMLRDPTQPRLSYWDFSTPSNPGRRATANAGREPCGEPAGEPERPTQDSDCRRRTETLRTKGNASRAKTTGSQATRESWAVRAVTLQGASATPSSAGRGSLVTRQSFVPAGGEERGTHKATSKSERRSGLAKGDFRERCMH
jgi:hypothetical protein